MIFPQQDIDENNYNKNKEVADEHLKTEMFEVRQERTYTGEGEMMETENTIVVVH